jgi:hypothetical protein
MIPSTKKNEMDPYVDFLRPWERPEKVWVQGGRKIVLLRIEEWEPHVVEHVERKFGIAREHLNVFFQLPCTIENDTDVTFLFTRNDDCFLDVFLRNVPKRFIIN